MNRKQIEREIDARRKRAIKVGIDTLIIRVYYEHGFRNYSIADAGSMAAIFPSAVHVVERERDRLDFRVKNHPYAIRTRARSYDGRDGVEMEVFRGEQVVFGAILDRRRNTGRFVTRRVTAFIEGSWIHDFERLDDEATAHRKKRSHADESAIVIEKARRFGINPADATESPSLLKRLLRAVSWRSA